MANRPDRSTSRAAKIHGDTVLSSDARCILGISCDYHDAAAALLVDGRVVAACEEERFTRVKHDNSLPERAVEACLELGGVTAGEVDAIAFHEKPLAVVNRVLAARQRRGLKSLPKFVDEFPVLLRRNLMIAYRIEKMMNRLGAKRPPRLIYGEHHLSHAAAAFYPSPFESAAILTVDGIGEWATATIGHGSHHRIELLEDQRFPNSYGLLYSLLTEWCGFQPNDGEYKLMGLAPFGKPTYREALDSIAAVSEDGALRIDGKAVKWFGAGAKLRKLDQLFDGPPLPRGAEPTEREANLAASIQQFTEDAMLSMARYAQRLTGERNLAMAGGVALNCVANGRVATEGPFENVWVQPAAGDAGSALGAALLVWHSVQAEPRNDPGASPFLPYLGPEYDEERCAAALDAAGWTYRRCEEAELVGEVAEALDDGKVVGWFQGRMEFGPRALGNRSFLADARSPTMQSELNLKTKGREGFRPFAPAVLANRAGEWFDMYGDSPYMLFTVPVAEAKRVPSSGADGSGGDGSFVDMVGQVRSEIPACTHVDYSARVQTVTPELNARFAALLEAFEARTGCPVLLNTSFNRAGEPIVCTPEDAVASASAASADLLVLGDLVAVPPSSAERTDG